jgi:hypothetical protein
MTIKTGHPQEIEVQALLGNVRVYAHLNQLRYVTASDREKHKQYIEEAENRLIEIERGIYKLLDAAMKEGVDVGRASPHEDF